MNWFFTADEHYGHNNIIKYCNRPFGSIEEMDYELINRHNSIVTVKDITVHAGDFTLSKNIKYVLGLIKELNGKHIFLQGSHDYWMKYLPGKNCGFILEKNLEGQMIVICHYCMRIWRRSHYNSWHLYGHSHGSLPSIGKSMDIGVDTNNFYPYPLETIKTIMEDKPDNPNLIKK